MASKIPVITSFLILPAVLVAQEGNWDVYMAQYEKGPGSTILNMSLKQIAPVQSLPFVLITGVSFKDCSDDGLPSKNEFSNLYKISDMVQTIVDAHTTDTLAGTFTYQCQRLDYYYISDTIGIREKLSKLYADYFKTYEPYINIKTDEKWEAYVSFLYPNEETYEFMQNQKIVTQLENSGDKLDKERQIDHWIYFTSDNDRSCFINYANQHNFKIEARETTKDKERSFTLQISRIDKADLSSITKVTLELRKQAEKCNGDYDGWETMVIK